MKGIIERLEERNHFVLASELSKIELQSKAKTRMNIYVENRKQIDEFVKKNITLISKLVKNFEREFGADTAINLNTLIEHASIEEAVNSLSE